MSALALASNRFTPQHNHLPTMSSCQWHQIAKVRTVATVLFGVLAAAGAVGTITSAICLTALPATIIATVTCLALATIVFTVSCIVIALLDPNKNDPAYRLAIRKQMIADLNNGKRIEALNTSGLPFNELLSEQEVNDFFTLELQSMHYSSFMHKHGPSVTNHLNASNRDTLTRRQKEEIVAHIHTDLACGKGFKDFNMSGFAPLTLFSSDAINAFLLPDIQSLSYTQFIEKHGLGASDYLNPSNAPILRQKQRDTVLAQIQADLTAGIGIKDLKTSVFSLEELFPSNEIDSFLTADIQSLSYDNFMVKHGSDALKHLYPANRTTLAHNFKLYANKHLQAGSRLLDLLIKEAAPLGIPDIDLRKINCVIILHGTRCTFRELLAACGNYDPKFIFTESDTPAMWTLFLRFIPSLPISIGADDVERIYDKFLMVFSSDTLLMLRQKLSTIDIRKYTSGQWNLTTLLKHNSISALQRSLNLPEIKGKVLLMPVMELLQERLKPLLEALDIFTDAITKKILDEKPSVLTFHRTIQPLLDKEFPTEQLINELLQRQIDCCIHKEITYAFFRSNNPIDQIADAHKPALGARFLEENTFEEILHDDYAQDREILEISSAMLEQKRIQERQQLAEAGIQKCLTGTQRLIDLLRDYPIDVLRQCNCFHQLKYKLFTFSMATLISDSFKDLRVALDISNNDIAHKLRKEHPSIQLFEQSIQPWLPPDFPVAHIAAKLLQIQVDRCLRNEISYTTFTSENPLADVVDKAPLRALFLKEHTYGQVLESNHATDRRILEISPEIIEAKLKEELAQGYLAFKKRNGIEVIKKDFTLHADHYKRAFMNLSYEDLIAENFSNDRLILGITFDTIKAKIQEELHAQRGLLFERFIDKYPKSLFATALFDHMPIVEQLAVDFLRRNLAQMIAGSLRTQAACHVTRFLPLDIQSAYTRTSEELRAENQQQEASLRQLEVTYANAQRVATQKLTQGLALVTNEAELQELASKMRIERARITEYQKTEQRLKEQHGQITKEIASLEQLTRTKPNRIPTAYEIQVLEQSESHAKLQILQADCNTLQYKVDAATIREQQQRSIAQQESQTVVRGILAAFRTRPEQARYQSIQSELAAFSSQLRSKQQEAARLQAALPVHFAPPNATFTLAQIQERLASLRHIQQVALQIEQAEAKLPTLRAKLQTLIFQLQQTGDSRRKTEADYSALQRTYTQNEEASRLAKDQVSKRHQSDMQQLEAHHAGDMEQIKMNSKRIVETIEERLYHLLTSRI